MFSPPQRCYEAKHRCSGFRFAAKAAQATRQENEMKTQEQKAHRFRKLHVTGEPLVLFNIWDPGSAKAVAKVGAKALATSSWAVSEACGYSDGEHTPLNLAIDNLRRITDATDL